ncbi:MAG: nitroreductase [Pseudonocardiales bacterium]|nr:MAG: nitroreductase [Pseudonocardiales bacterium]
MTQQLPDQATPAAVRAAARFDLASVEAALAVAARAPSIYNSQPWRWELGPEGLTLRADRSRLLAVADPDGHSLVLSCGAALALAELGLRAAGWSVTVDRLPEAVDPDLLARLRPFERVEPSRLDADRVAAAWHRHSDRRPFAKGPVPPHVVDQLRAAASQPGVYADFTAGQDDDYIKLAVAISQADRIERHNAAYVEELTSWVRPDTSHPDGVAVTSVPHLSIVHPRHSDVALRNFEQAVPGVQLIDLDVDEHPLLAIVLTTSFGPLAHLQAGEAMMNLMIEADLQGLATCALSQAVDLLAFRSRLQTVMGWMDHPQMMLRIGYPAVGEPPPSTARRSVSDVLLVQDLDH